MTQRAGYPLIWQGRALTRPPDEILWLSNGSSAHRVGEAVQPSCKIGLIFSRARELLRLSANVGL